MGGFFSHTGSSGMGAVTPQSGKSFFDNYYSRPSNPFTPTSSPLSPTPGGLSATDAAMMAWATQPPKPVAPAAVRSTITPKIGPVASSKVPTASSKSYVSPTGAPGGLPTLATGFPVNNANTGVSSIDPGLQQEFYNWLQSQVGTGAKSFAGQNVPLPTGGTSKGLLTAPLNTASAQAYNFAAGKPSNVPGLTNIAAATVPINTTGGVGGQQLTNISKGLPINANIPASLQQMAQTGSPIDQTAAWKAMVAAEQQQIANNAALLREQYNVGGANPGSSSPGSLGMANFYEQTALGQTAQLTQAQAQAMENAAQRQLQAGEYIQGQGQQAQEFTQGQQLTASQQLQAQSQQGQEFQAQQQQQAGQFLSSLGTGLDQMFQGMDQSAIQNALSEFIRTNPEYSPLLNTIFSAASTFPPTVRNSYGAGLAGLLGALAPLLGLLKPKASAPGAPGGAGGAGGTGGAGGSAGPTQPTQVPTQQPQQAPPPTQTGGSTSTVYPDPTDPFFSSQGSPTGTLGTSEGVYTGFDNQNPFNLIYPNDTSNMPVDSGQVPSAGLSGIPSFTSGGNDASGNINPDEQAIIDSMLSMGYPGYDVGTSQDPNFGNLYT